MRFAETPGRRSLIVVTALVAALAGGMLLADLMTCRQQPKHRTPVRAMHGCNKARNVKPVTPPAAVEPTPTNPYVEVLRSAREPLSACVHGQAANIELVLLIPPTGNVELEVTARADNLATVDMGVIKCVEAAIRPLEFPRGETMVRVSTRL